MGAEFSITTYLIWMFSGALYLIGLASFYSWLHKEARGYVVERTRRLLLFASGALLCGFMLAKLMQETAAFTHEMMAINLTVLIVTVVYVVLDNHHLEQVGFNIGVIAVCAWWFMPQVAWPVAGVAAGLLLLDWGFAEAINAHWWSYLLAIYLLAATILGPDDWVQHVSGGIIFAQVVQVAIEAGVVRGYSQLIRKQAARTKRLAHESRYDGLTGLQNFRAFTDALQAAYERFAQSGQRYALYTLDVDHFKAVNDTYGHLYGNRVLKAVAKQLQQTLQTVGFQNAVYRTGGEEFSFVLYDIQESAVMAEQITRAIQQALAQLVFKVDGEVFHVTVSIGEDRVLASDENYLDAYERADEYLYQSKQNGRNAITLRGQTLPRR